MVFETSGGVVRRGFVNHCHGKALFFFFSLKGEEGNATGNLLPPRVLKGKSRKTLKK